MTRQLVLGMGAGQCGLRLLAEILAKQPGARVTHEQPPLLPWVQEPGGPGIHERLERILQTRSERVVGDVASFYLPYAEEAIARQPGIRIVCLKRPREEIVAAFCHFLDQGPYPINHWARQPAPGWWHDPFWTRIFPQYETQDREEGIGLYWDEYYARAEDLAARFHENLRVWDTEALTTEEGVREVLTFAGFERGEQVVVIGKRPPAVAPAPPVAPVAHAARVQPKGPGEESGEKGEEGNAEAVSHAGRVRHGEGRVQPPDWQGLGQ